MTYEQFKDNYNKMTKAERNHPDNVQHRNRMRDEEFEKERQETKQSVLDKFEEIRNKIEG